MMPGIGTLAGASIALVGTRVPSGKAWLSVLTAPAELLTRLRVQAPEISASGTIVIALLLRENAELLDIADISPFESRRTEPPMAYARSSATTTLPRLRHAYASTPGSL